MTSSLVGSEMCIRDRLLLLLLLLPSGRKRQGSASIGTGVAPATGCLRAGCLLYTSDAADDM
eukprot:5244241-Prorocentrum_lima.AAC.1